MCKAEAEHKAPCNSDNSETANSFSFSLFVKSYKDTMKLLTETHKETKSNLSDETPFCQQVVPYETATLSDKCM